MPMTQRTQVMTRTERVKLYYLGGFANDIVYVTSKGAAYAVPPPGGFIEVPAYAARDIIRRNRRPDGTSVFTLSEHQVALVRRLQNPPVQERELTREELLAKLAELDNTEVPEVSKGKGKGRKAADLEAESLEVEVSAFAGGN